MISVYREACSSEGTEPLQIINEIGVDIYPVGVYYKDS